MFEFKHGSGYGNNRIVDIAFTVADTFFIAEYGGNEIEYQLSCFLQSILLLTSKHMLQLQLFIKFLIQTKISPFYFYINGKWLP